MVVVASVLFVSIIGLMFGNYATTAFYRLPNNKAINGYGVLSGKRPHCSHCGHLLKFYEYLPLLSWFSTWFSCNYCSARTDYAYFLLEIFGLIAAVALYFLVGLNMAYVVLLCSWVCFALFFALFVRYGRIYYRVLALQVILIGWMLLWEVIQ